MSDWIDEHVDNQLTVPDIGCYTNPFFELKNDLLVTVDGARWTPKGGWGGGQYLTDWSGEQPDYWGEVDAPCAESVLPGLRSAGWSTASNTASCS